MTWLPKRTVVVPTDLSELSLASLDTARQLVGSSDGLHLVYVLAPLAAMEPGVVWETVDDESRRRHAERAVREALPDDLAGVAVVVRIGNPAVRITEYAKECGAELIVMPSHGRTGAARLLIGSVAETVVRHAHCPVLVLRS